VFSKFYEIARVEKQQAEGQFGNFENTSEINS
jgi:hypothetical protein